MNSKNKGDLSEARALYEFQKYNIPVLIPWGDNLRYDMVIELQGEFKRVQVKTCNEERGDAIKCYCRSSTNHTTNKGYHLYTGQIDYFVFYNQTHNLIALVPIEDTENQKEISLRISKPKNGQSKGIRYWSDYSFDKILCVETLHEEPKS